jgi:hypothetical protein
MMMTLLFGVMAVSSAQAYEPQLKVFYSPVYAAAPENDLAWQGQTQLRTEMRTAPGDPLVGEIDYSHTWHISLIVTEVHYNIAGTDVIDTDVHYYNFDLTNWSYPGIGSGWTVVDMTSYWESWFEPISPWDPFDPNAIYNQLHIEFDVTNDHPGNDPSGYVLAKVSDSGGFWEMNCEMVFYCGIVDTEPEQE